ncbi:histidinol dehydrogenase [Chitinophaga sp. SYP-B3965]|uniref:histidinol dehydrogenase n=1 Tax=Chitinophaga sp. SYP-B3965 TaxID=2663120 RepID=UPI001299BFD0|nr:histidinol dehydrogenase [Chitinophaga sp. SYP-B3965]MRG46090.1 histidinol dehydrogenase [Chitinophaga sp. SYP-B3965]
MQIIRFPEKNTWNTLLQRPAFDTRQLEATVSAILADVKATGDAALRKYTQQFDKVTLTDIRVTAAEFEAADASLDESLKSAIRQAALNIEAFHRAQIEPVTMIETMPGVQCWRKPVGIEKVGLYIPGGTAPLFSTILMLAIPARLAGCSEIVLCTPPGKDGIVHPAVLWAAHFTGITQVFKTGGVQAIGAMAYGTESIPKVYKIFGPGNQYVTCAKQLVNSAGIAIDMPAGPSEVAVFADETCVPAFVAADLLSQAEHGADSQVLLVTTSEKVILEVEKEVALQLALLPRKDLAAKALDNSKLILVKDRDEAMDMLNDYAPEHLIMACENDEALATRVINAGSVFLGNYSPESAGDYASGTNHTLPTNGYATAYSGVSVDSFVKKITFQRLSREGLTALAPAIEAMAAAEGLDAHKNAVSIRLKSN